MHLRQSSASLALAALLHGVALVALTGCSQEENLVADPGASPFYPAKADSNGTSTRPATASDKPNVSPGLTSALDDSAGPRVGGSPIDARFGTNDVERQLRAALRAAQKGDMTVAGDTLDKILAVEPINREALRGRAKIFMEQASRATAIDDKLAAIDKAVERIDALRRAYDVPKPDEKELVSRIHYAKFKALVEKGEVGPAVVALKTACETGLDGFARVELDESLAKFRSSPEYKAAHQADDEKRLADARTRTRGVLAGPLNVPFEFTLPDLGGKKVSLADFKGKVVLVDFWGTWCGPCREAIPFLIGLYHRQHSQGLEIVGLDYERDATSESQHLEMAKKFVQSANIPYRCLLGDEQTVKRVPGFRGFPTTVLIDRAGKVRLLITENNAQTPELTNDAVRVLLAEPAPKEEPAKKKP